MAAFPAGSKAYVECGNEPWNYEQAYTQFRYFIGLARTKFSNGSAMVGYAYIASQQHTWFYNALQANGRGSELVRVFNCQAAVSSTAEVLFTWLSANSVYADMIVIAPYFSNAPADLPSMTSIYAGLNAGQILDLADAYLAYANYYQPLLGAYQAAVSGHTGFAGQPVALGCYEGGISGLSMGGSGPQQELQAVACHYHPQVGALTTGYMAILQSYGFSIFNYYCLDQVPVVESGSYQTATYGVYLAYGALPGKGDGSDGLHDNLPDIAGTPPSAPNLLLDVTPIGAAINSWNGMGTVVTTTYNHPRSTIKPRLNRSQRRLFSR